MTILDSATDAVGVTALDDMIFISVDDHVIEPPDLFEGRLPSAFQDRAPYVVTRDDGAQAWVYEGQEVTSMGLNAVAGRPPEEWGLEPDRFVDMRDGCYDVHSRVHDLNVAGVLASMCFPSYPQFCGQRFSRTEDKELALHVIRAYNDWHIEAWCGSYPDRLIPQALVPLWDPQLIAAEVRRVAAMGCHAVSFSENPYKLGLPGLPSDHWDPFWAACQETNTVVDMHLGSSSSLPTTSPGATIETSQALAPTSLITTATELVFAPFMRKFADLKIALSEGGIGWIPYLLERVDYTFKRHHTWTGSDLGGKLPSEIFREHVVSCFIEDNAGLRLKDLVGVDMLCWEMDYPHSDSSWPYAPESFAPSAEVLTRAEIDAITHRNAMRIYSFDPFGKRTREQSTVRALRALTNASDLEYKSSERLRGKATTHPTAEAITVHF